jgi:hypothetical protein
VSSRTISAANRNFGIRIDRGYGALLAAIQETGVQPGREDASLSGQVVLHGKTQRQVVFCGERCHRRRQRFSRDIHDRQNRILLLHSDDVKGTSIAVAARACCATWREHSIAPLPGKSLFPHRLYLGWRDRVLGAMRRRTNASANQFWYCWGGQARSLTNIR